MRCGGEATSGELRERGFLCWRDPVSVRLRGIVMYTGEVTAGRNRYACGDVWVLRLVCRSGAATRAAATWIDSSNRREPSVRPLAAVLIILTPTPGASLTMSSLAFDLVTCFTGGHRYDR